MLHIIHESAAAPPARWAQQNSWNRPARAGHAIPEDPDRAKLAAMSA
jgi:hypothetical protein